MTTGSKIGPQGCVPLDGESTIVQGTAATDILTVKGAASQTGDFLVCQNSSGTEKFCVDYTGKITIMGVKSVALASLASNASATVAFTGITTDFACIALSSTAQTGPLPVLWASDTDKLGYGAPSVACAAQSIMVVAFKTV